LRQTYGAPSLFVLSLNATHVDRRRQLSFEFTHHLAPTSEIMRRVYAHSPSQTPRTQSAIEDFSPTANRIANDLKEILNQTGKVRCQLVRTLRKVVFTISFEARGMDGQGNVAERPSLVEPFPMVICSPDAEFRDELSVRVSARGLLTAQVADLVEVERRMSFGEWRHQDAIVLAIDPGSFRRRANRSALQQLCSDFQGRVGIILLGAARDEVLESMDLLQLQAMRVIDPVFVPDLISAIDGFRREWEHLMPIYRQAESAQAAQDTMASRTDEKRVLLLEDDPIQRNHLLQVLLHAGCVVDCAPMGMRSLMARADTSYDVVFLDLDSELYELRVMSAALRHGDCGVTGRRLIGLSLHPDERTSRLEQQLDLDGILPKPPEVEQLRGMVWREHRA
jgi:CheY-like chemotaxis protein